MIIAILVTAVGCRETVATSPPVRPSESAKVESPAAALSPLPEATSNPASGSPRPPVDLPATQDSQTAAPVATTGAIVLLGNGLGW